MQAARVQQRRRGRARVRGGRLGGAFERRGVGALFQVRVRVRR